MRPLGELLWLVPLLVAVSVVVGAAGHEGRPAIQASIGRTLRAFTVGVLGLAVLLHVVAAILA